MRWECLRSIPRHTWRLSFQQPHDQIVPPRFSDGLGRKLPHLLGMHLEHVTRMCVLDDGPSNGAQSVVGKMYFRITPWSPPSTRSFVKDSNQGRLLSLGEGPIMMPRQRPRATLLYLLPYLEGTKTHEQAAKRRYRPEDTPPCIVERYHSNIHAWLNTS